MAKKRPIKASAADKARIYADIQAHPDTSLADVAARTGLPDKIIKGGAIALIKVGKIHGSYGNTHKARRYTAGDDCAATMSAVDAYLVRNLPKLDRRGAIVHAQMDRGHCARSPEPPSRRAVGLQSSLAAHIGGAEI